MLREIQCPAGQPVQVSHSGVTETSLQLPLRVQTTSPLRLHTAFPSHMFPYNIYLLTTQRTWHYQDDLRTTFPNKWHFTWSKQQNRHKLQDFIQHTVFSSISLRHLSLAVADVSNRFHVKTDPDHLLVFVKVTGVTVACRHHKQNWLNPNDQ